MFKKSFVAMFALLLMFVMGISSVGATEKSTSDFDEDNQVAVEIGKVKTYSYLEGEV